MGENFGLFKSFGDRLFEGETPTNLGLIGSTTLNDTDVTAFFNRVTAAGGTLTATEQDAINTLVFQMKAAGVWTGMKAIYPMVGSSAAACAQNLKSASFTATFSSGWTFASTGATPNGAAFMNTTLTPNTSLTLNNTHLSFYSRTNSSGNKVDIGTNDNSTTYLPLFKMLIRDASNVATFLQYSFLAGETLTFSNTNSQGMYIGSRISSTSHKAYKNNSLAGTITTSNSQSAISQWPLYIGASNNNSSPNEYSDRECGFATIGDGLNDTQAANFYNLVQAFQTTLSRQV
jgi:hypothetical protein